MMIALIIPSIGADCASDDGGSSGSNAPRSESDDWNDRDNSSNDSDPLEIPRKAQVLKDYPAGAFSWKADTSGYVWIYDLDERESMQRVEIRKGELLQVLPDENRIKVDGDTRSKSNLHRHSRHRLYLLSDDRRYGQNRDDDRNGNENNDKNNDIQTVEQPKELRNTTLIKEFRASTFEWKSTARGRVVLFDVKSSKAVVEFKVNKNQKIVVEPKKDRVTLDGKMVYDRNLESNGTYRLYFDAE